MNEQETRDLIRKVLTEEFDKNYNSGNPRIPPHTHNGVDNLKIRASNIVDLAAGGFNGIQVFTASGTFTVPTGFTQFWVRLVGGGAGSGATSGPDTVGDPGGAGGYSEDVVDLTGVSTVTVTIGAAGSGGVNGGAAATAGGNTTFGSYMTGNGGAVGGSGGTASGGTLNITGYAPGVALRLAGAGTTTNVGRNSAQGGSSYFGPGAQPASAAIGGGTDGNVPTAYGAGASGAAAGSSGGPNNGAAGMTGFLVIIW